MSNNDGLIDLMESATKKPEGPENQVSEYKDEPFLGSPISIIAVIAFTVLVIGSLIYGSYQCEGTYVVGLFQMECIE